MVLGGAIGARFVGMAPKELWRVMLLAALVAVLMVLVATGAAYGPSPPPPASRAPPSFSRWRRASSPR